MKTELFAAVAVLAFALAAGAGSAQAVIPGALTVKVPFDFVVGTTTMPAGEYTVSNPSQEAPCIIEVRSADGAHAVFVQTEPAAPEGSKFVEKSELNFRKVDGKEYLAGVWVAGTGEGNVILPSLIPTHTEKAPPRGN